MKNLLMIVLWWILLKSTTAYYGNITGKCLDVPQAISILNNTSPSNGSILITLVPFSIERVIYLDIKDISNKVRYVNLTEPYLTTLCYNLSQDLKIEGDITCSLDNYYLISYETTTKSCEFFLNLPYDEDQGTNSLLIGFLVSIILFFCLFIKKMQSKRPYTNYSCIKVTPFFVYVCCLRIRRRAPYEENGPRVGRIAATIQPKKKEPVDPKKVLLSNLKKLTKSMRKKRLINIFGSKIEKVEEDSCVVCMAENNQIRFKPCGHAVTCGNCATALLEREGNCPLCRAKILDVESFATSNTVVSEP